MFTIKERIQMHYCKIKLNKQLFKKVKMKKKSTILAEKKIYIFIIQT